MSPSEDPPSLLVRRQGNTSNIIRIEKVSKPPKRYGERSQQPLERDARAPSKAPLSSIESLDEAGSNRREPRLQSLTPAESPFLVRQPLAAGRSRCSLGLPPLRGLPNQPLDFRPPLMRLPPGHLRPPSEENAQKSTAWPRFRVSIRLTLERSPKRSFSLPEVYHLIQPPPEFPPTSTSKPADAVSSDSCKQAPLLGFGCHKL
jgi:hypothetical protein